MSRLYAGGSEFVLLSLNEEHIDRLAGQMPTLQKNRVSPQIRKLSGCKLHILDGEKRHMYQHGRFRQIRREKKRLREKQAYEDIGSVRRQQRRAVFTDHYRVNHERELPVRRFSRNNLDSFRSAQSSDFCGCRWNVIDNG